MISSLSLAPRHQLRLHMAISGHAILGDVTYEFKPSELMTNHLSHDAIHDNHEGIQKQKLNRRGVSSCHRMCLHAYSLTVPILQCETYQRSLTNEKISGKDITSTNSTTFQANDPFIISKANARREHGTVKNDCDKNEMLQII